MNSGDYLHRVGEDVLDGQNVVKLFFQRYPGEFVENKLWEFYCCKSMIGEPFDYGSPPEDLRFYEDLLGVIQQLKQLDGHGRVPTLIAPAYYEHTMVCLEGVVDLIKRAIPVGMIYSLSKGTQALDLIVVLEKSCNTAYDEFEDIVDLSVLGYPDGICTVHNYGLLHSLISKGHFFYATACIEEHLVYRKSSEAFPKFNFTVEMKLTMEELFRQGAQKASCFYSGAQHYCEAGEYEMAMFMLQQTTELTYRCLLNVLRGRDVKCHSPSALRKHLKRFAPEVIGLFSEDEDTELLYLQVLEDAYVKSRYQSEYRADGGLTLFLNERIGVLLDRARDLFSARLKILDELIVSGGISPSDDG